jgi:hypothetical protein
VAIEQGLGLLPPISIRPSTITTDATRRMCPLCRKQCVVYQKPSILLITLVILASTLA